MTQKTELSRKKGDRFIRGKVKLLRESSTECFPWNKSKEWIKECGLAHVCSRQLPQHYFSALIYTSKTGKCLDHGLYGHSLFSCLYLVPNGII